MNWELLPEAAAILIASAVSLGLSVYTWEQTRGASISRAFALFCLGMVIWSASYALEILSANLPVKLFWSNLQFFGTGMLPVGFLTFALIYAEKEAWLTSKTRFALVLEPLLTILLVYTDDLHGLVRRNIHLDLQGAFVTLGFDQGVWYWLNSLYILGLMLAGSIILLLYLFGTQRFYRGQALALAVGIISPWAANLAGILGLNPLAPLDLTVFAFALTNLAFAWTIVRYRFPNIMPIARHALVENMAEGVITLDREGRVLDMNSTAGSMLGIASDRALGKPLRELLEIDLLKLLPRRPQSVRQVIEISAQPPRYFEASVSPLIRRTGGSSGWLLLLRDISEQKSLELALHASEEKYRSVAERANDGIMIVQDYRIKYGNPQLAAMLGMAQIDLLEAPFLNLWPEGERGLAREQYESRLRGEYMPARYETQLLHKDGRLVQMEVNAGVMDFQGRPADLVFLRDITERKKFEAERAKTMALLQATIESTAYAIIVIDQNENVIAINQKFLELWRLPARWGSLPGAQERLKMVAGLVKDPLGFTRRFRQLNDQLDLKGNDVWELSDGRVIEQYALPYIVAGRIAGRLYTFLDITERKKAENAEREARQLNEALRAAGATLSSTLDYDQVLDLILEQIKQIIDYDAGILLEVHEGHASPTRLRAGDPASKTLLTQLKGVSYAIEETPHLKWMADQRQPLVIADTAGYAEWGRYKTLSQARSWVGVPLFVHDQVIAFLTLEKSGAGFYGEKQAALLAIYANQAALTLQNSTLFTQVQHMAITDPLTGLYNRRYFFNLAQHEFERARRYSSPLSALMLDIDHFKRVNDTHGHLAGDQVLCEIARICQASLRKVDIIARYGGEEFVILLPETGLKEARVTGERLRAQVASTGALDREGVIRATISLGAAVVDGKCESLEALLEGADQALYRAKQAGRNRVAV